MSDTTTETKTPETETPEADQNTPESAPESNAELSELKEKVAKLYLRFLDQTNKKFFIWFSPAFGISFNPSFKIAKNYLLSQKSKETGTEIVDEKLSELEKNILDNSSYNKKNLDDMQKLIAAANSEEALEDLKDKINDGKDPTMEEETPTTPTESQNVVPVVAATWAGAAWVGAAWSIDTDIYSEYPEDLAGREIKKNNTYAYPVASVENSKNVPEDKKRWRIIRGIGPRRWKNHAGIDIPAAKNTPLVAAAAGQVVAISDKDGHVQLSEKCKKGQGFSGYGNCVVIRSEKGERMMYGHMNMPTTLKLGETVALWQQVGVVGSTGKSSGDHLHFEIRQEKSNIAKDGKVSFYSDTEVMDPVKFLPVTKDMLTQAFRKIMSERDPALLAQIDQQAGTYQQAA